MINLLCILWTPYIMAQQCILLGPDSICGPAFNGAPVNFSSISEFNATMNLFKNESMAAENINSYESCNLDAAKARSHQYQISFFCSLLVYDAIEKAKCSPADLFNKDSTRICSIVCNSAKTSLKRTLSSCQKPEKILSTFICETLSSTSNECFAGVSLEKDNCGKSNFSYQNRI